MMKYYQLLILGNGFDVHCWLQSRYKDFFRNALLDTIGEPFGLRQLRASVSGFWENLLLEYHKAYSDVDYKWCDIETIIKNTLISTFYIDKQMSICVWKNALQSTKSGSDSDDATKTTRNSIIQYIYKYCMRFFYNVLSQQKAYSDDELLQLLIAHILQELYNFEQRFCKYIKSNIVNPKNSKELNEKYIVNAMNLLATLTGFTDMRYENIDDIIEQQDEEYWEQLSPTMRQSAWRETHLLSQEYTNLHSTNILSFNYTALFDILEVESPCCYSNVHGKLCNKNCATGCNSSSIIFGIDDGFIQSNDQYAGLRLFSKTYRKMFDTSSPISILPTLNENSAITIKFYGHSLNEADYSYFQSIFDYYNLYSNDRVALVFYYSKGYEQTDSIYRLINSYGNTLTNKEQGKNLIHKLLLENRLKIVEID